MLVELRKFLGSKSLSLGGRVLRADELAVGLGVATVTEVPVVGVPR
jgi:hypothetical protein